MSRFRSRDFRDGYTAGLGSSFLMLLLYSVLLFLFGCGATITGLRPCTAENADQIQYDDKGRAVMYVCL